MIATIRGEISYVEEHALIIEVGSVGLRVFAPVHFTARHKSGEAVFLHTHLIVRENDLSLYGFESASERSLFTLLLGVDGVGPKVALAVLSSLNADAITRAVSSETAEVFSRVPGVGKKTAQKIVLHLQGKLKYDDPLHAIASMSEADSEVLAALTTLGYSVIEAQTAIQSLAKDAPTDVENRLRAALGFFNSSR